jgi:hypothetical protein
VNRIDAGNRLDFHNYFVDDEIYAICAIDLGSLVEDRKRNFS